MLLNSLIHYLVYYQLIRVDYGPDRLIYATQSPMSPKKTPELNLRWPLHAT